MIRASCNKSMNCSARDKNFLFPTFLKNDKRRRALLGLCVQQASYVFGGFAVALGVESAAGKFLN